MFLIRSVNSKGWRWVSGVFDNRTSAYSELTSISAGSSVSHEMVEVGPDQFPVFIIEDKGFTCVSLPELLQRLDALEPNGSTDFVHFNVYALREAFKPAVPGRDDMGRIMHWHVDDDALNEPRASVFRTELVELASDA
jgi:hypothetical protein